MNEFRRISPGDLPAFGRIVANAYPALNLNGEEEQRRFVERATRVHNDPEEAGYYGLYRDGALLGGMRMFDFTMNLFGRRTPVGGVGLVAVDLLHKREHVARDLIAAFLHHYRARGAPLAALYPFRPDFYRQMGFGYGTPISQYRLRPAHLPRLGDKRNLAFLSREDIPALVACYQRYAAAHHGMFDRRAAVFEIMFDRPSNVFVGVRGQAGLDGYMVFQYNTGRSFLENDLEVVELVYNGRAALHDMLTFLHTQDDQFKTIVLHTLDEFFYFLPFDPRNGSGNLLPSVYHETGPTGVGLMYRVIDTPGVFAALGDHNFGGQSCRVLLTIDDSFLPENSGSTLVAFADGRASLPGDGAHDVELRMPVAEFSALLLGVVPFERLYTYGLAEISDPSYLPVVTRLFAAERKPICLTRF